MKELLGTAFVDAIARPLRHRESVRAGGKVILFGNGGSAADATHVAAEFVGRFAFDRAPMPALSLSDNVSAVTAIGNDYAYDLTFARQLKALRIARRRRDRPLDERLARQRAECAARRA